MWHACFVFFLFLPIFHQTLQFLETLSFRGAAATRNKLSVGKQNKTLQNGKSLCTVPGRNPAAECLECGGELWEVQGGFECLDPLILNSL